MKAIIVAAGRSRSDRKFYFPKDSKPKCLYHVGGKTLLDMAVTSLRTAGIDDIRIVTGYHKEDIEAYNEKNNLGLEIVFNPDWEKSAPSSLFAGLKGVNDDVLIVLSDIVFSADVIRDFINCPEPLAWLKLDKRPGRTNYPDCIDKDISIVKVAKDRFDIFDNIDTVYMIRKFRWKSTVSNHIATLLFEALRNNGPRGEICLDKLLLEVDYYHETDEWKRSVGRLK